jgi:hypothetical protein
MVCMNGRSAALPSMFSAAYVLAACTPFAREVPVSVFDRGGT